MSKTKEIKYYEVQKVDTIKQLLEMAVEQDGDKIAFKYKKGKEVIDVRIIESTAKETDKNKVIRENQEKMTLYNIESSITYKNVYESTDLEYVILFNKIKKI